MSYAVDVGELPTWQMVDLESSGFVDHVSDKPCSFRFEGFDYQLTRGSDSDPLPDFRGMVPRDSMGRYVRLPNPHWYYWDSGRGRWVEHPWPPMAKTVAEVVPIREGLEVVEGEDKMTFAEMLDEAIRIRGGINYLVEVATEHPLEFLKLRARMVSLDMKSIGGGDVNVVVNTINDSGLEYKDPEVPEDI